MNEFQDRLNEEFRKMSVALSNIKAKQKEYSRLMDAARKVYVESNYVTLQVSEELFKAAYDMLPSGHRDNVSKEFIIDQLKTHIKMGREANSLVLKSKFQPNSN